jgi:hypothetical protein
MTVDFAQLYAQLGIRTDCSLEEFKQACRRRIRQQHPDRAGIHTASTADIAAQIPLAELLPLYAKALRFHRKHGRLPGAPAVHAHAGLPRKRLFPTAIVATTAAPGEGITDATNATRFTMRGPLLLMLAIAAALVGISAWNDQAPAPAPPARGPMPAEAVEAETRPVVLRLEIGMDPEAVRRIQGEPLQQDGSQWIYGPSWLYFERGRLADWYSSPLYPLKTATSSPSDDDAERE